MKKTIKHEKIILKREVKNVFSIFTY